MAARERTVTLNLDFKIDKQKLKDVGDILEKDLSKNLSGEKAVQYANNLKSAFSDAFKTIGGLLGDLNKPLITRSQARETASNIEGAFKGLDQRLISIQANLAKSLNTPSNANALKQIREIGKEIDKMVADYEKVGELFGQARSIGTQGALKAELTAANKELKTLEQKGDQLSKAEISREKELQKIIEETNKKLETRQKLRQQGADILSQYGVDSKTGLGNLIDEKATQQKELINTSISIQDFNSLRKVIEEIRDALKGVSQESQATAENVTKVWDTADQANRDMEQQSRTFRSVLKDLGLPLLTLNELASTFRTVARYSYNYIKQLDAALTEISIVSGKTRNEVLELTDTFIELSAKTGMAIDDIAKASTIFYQQGLDDDAVRKLTEYTAIFAKISSETVETASDQITAAINGFGWSVEQAGDVIDKLSVLAAYSAADIDELATAMSKAASQANMAGLSFDQYNAYLATMIEVTREAPENIGTSLKTIMSRFQQVKEDVADDGTDVNQVEKALRSVGIALRDEEGQLRDLGDVLEELGPKWNSLSRNTQAYLGTVIAGTRQQSRFVSLMQHWDRALELTTASQNSAGAATRMHQAAMEGLAASLNNLTNAWQKLISSIVNGDTFKTIIDSLTGFVRWLGNGHALLKVFTILITTWNAKTLITNANLLVQNKRINNLNVAFHDLYKAVDRTKTALANLNVPLEASTQEMVQQADIITDLINKYDGLAAAKARANNAPVAATNGGSIANGPTFTDNSANIFPGAKPTKFTLGNVTSVIGSIQTGLMVSAWITAIVTALGEWINPTAESLKNKAQDAFDKTQEEIDKLQLNIDVIEQTGEAYDKLSKKINKSADEVKDLAEAAEALAKAAPGAVIGYDSSGNPIIDTNKARQIVNKQGGYKEQLANLSIEQIGNLGALNNAELRAEAEANKKNEKNTAGILKTISTIALTVGVIAVSAAAIAASGGTALPAIVPVAGSVLAAGGIGGYLGAESGLDDVLDAEEARLAKQEAKKIISKYRNELLEALQNITNLYLDEITNNGVTAEERAKTYSFLQSAWSDDYMAQLYKNSVVNNEFDSSIFEAGMAKMGLEWQETLKKIDINLFDKAIADLKEETKDIGNMTYQQMSDAIDEIINRRFPNIDKNSDLYKTLRSAFFSAAYDGTSAGVNLIIDDLKERKDNAITDERKAEYDRAIDLVSNSLTTNQSGFYNSIGLFNDVSMLLNTIDNAGVRVNQALERSTEAAKLVVIEYLETAKRETDAEIEALEAAGDTTSDYYKQMKQQSLDLGRQTRAIWNSMAESAETTWTQLFSELETLTDKVQVFYKSYGSILSGNGLGYSDLKGFFALLDDVDLSVFSDTQLVAYGNALDRIANGMKVVNGQMYIEADGMKTIADLEKVLVEAKIKTMAQDLLNTKSYLESENTIIDAQIASIDSYLSGEADKTEANEKWLAAQKSMGQAYVLSEEGITGHISMLYGEMYADILMKRKKFLKALTSDDITEQDIKDVRTFWGDVQDNFNYDAYFENVLSGKTDEEIKEMRARLNRRRAENDIRIKNINAELAILQSGLLWTQNGVEGGLGDTSKIEQYIGKLKEVYNILNRIASINHRLDLLDQYQEIAKGDTYASILKERIGYNEELMNQYAFLIPEMQAFTNGYRDFILSVDGLEGVFDFDKFGQIIINWDKYNALQTETIEGQVSMKEKADDVYDTYMDMWEDVSDKASEYVKVLKAIQDEYQEVLDTYLKVEHDTADAIKEIYQEILDTRLDAIDQEKEALEELREARERANKEQKASKEVAGIQSDIQRAMMDTSGASATNLIKAQSNLDEKLNEIAEDKYSEMLNNIIERLDEEKQSLQDEFDEMFYDMTWLFEELEQHLMMDEGGLASIYSQTQEWREETPLERQIALDQLHQNFQVYWKHLNGDKGITDIYNQIIWAADRITEIDEALKTEVSKIPAEVAQTLGKWQQGIESQINSISSSANSGAWNGNGYSWDIKDTLVTPGDTTLPPSNYKAGGSDIPASTFKPGDKVKPIVNGLLQFTKSYDWNGTEMKESSESYLSFKGNNGNGFTVGNKSDDIIYYQGQYYYKTKQGHYIKGLQLEKYALGGFVDFTGPAMLHGSSAKPEAVLNALQTEHFIKFTNALDHMYGQMGSNAGGSISIDTISFNVESMSSPEDGERAFNMFVNKFNEIGNQTGIKFNNFKNTL